MGVGTAVTAYSCVSSDSSQNCDSCDFSVCCDCGSNIIDINDSIDSRDWLLSGENSIIESIKRRDNIDKGIVIES